MTERLLSKPESDKYTRVYYVAQKPRKRDFLRILLGRYTPVVKRVEELTPEGYKKLLKETWTGPEVHRAFCDAVPFLSLDDAAAHHTGQP